MITITESKLIIELEHSSPEQFIFDLKQGIIDSIQAQDPQAVNTEELQEANNTLLELLRSII